MVRALYRMTMAPSCGNPKETQPKFPEHTPSQLSGQDAVGADSVKDFIFCQRRGQGSAGAAAGAGPAMSDSRLPPDGPCGGADYRAHLSRQPESVDVGWAVWCHAKTHVPRSLNPIPSTCPLSLLRLPPALPHHRLDLLHPSRRSRGIGFPPPDRAWPGSLEYLDR
uniref:Uncharacterized protein n=1 Tax=Knipowitschia caucasica TaxID=637954 RepID=A0AAV2JZB7_KNICA